eukprot:COSAG02_NODE_3245_length_7102_cov_2.575753_2_plen_78_part_00
MCATNPVRDTRAPARRAARGSDNDQSVLDKRLRVYTLEYIRTKTVQIVVFVYTSLRVTVSGDRTRHAPRWWHRRTAS